MYFLIKFSVLLTIIFTPVAQAGELFAGSGDAAKSLEECNTHLNRLNHVIGWQVQWPRQWQAIVENGPENIGDVLNKWEGFSAAINEAIDDLNAGLDSQRVAPRVVAANVHQQVVGLLSILREPKSPMKFSESDHKQAKLWNGFVENAIVPSVTKFEHFLRSRYLPKASEYSGLYGTQGNRECFFSAVASWTSLRLSQDEIERIGQYYLNSSLDKLAKTSRLNESVDDLKIRLKDGAGNGEVGKNEIIAISESAIDNAFNKFRRLFCTRLREILL